MSLDMFDLPDITSNFDLDFNDPAFADIPLLSEAKLKEFDFLGDLALPDIDLDNKTVTVQDAPSTSEPCGSEARKVDVVDPQLIEANAEPTSVVPSTPRSGEHTFQRPQLSSQQRTQNLYYLDPTSQRLVPVPSDRVYRPCSPPPGYATGGVGPPPSIHLSTPVGQSTAPSLGQKRTIGLDSDFDDVYEVGPSQPRPSKKSKPGSKQSSSKVYPDSVSARKEFHKRRAARRESVKKLQRAERELKNKERAALETAKRCELEHMAALERANNYRKQAVELAG